MKTVSISEVEVSDRQRKIFVPKHIEDLAESIARRGLLHPPVLQRNGEGYILVAGERRLRAIQMLHDVGLPVTCDGHICAMNHTPFLELSDLTELERKETELDENLLREDLTWQERNDAIAELHRLREGQNPAQTRQETAREIAEKTDVSRSTAERSVHRALLLDQFKNDPEVSRARSEPEAFKIASRKIEEEFRINTARELPKRGQYACIRGDLREVMPTLKADFYTSIIADPPYGMGADEFGDNASNIHDYADNPETALDIAESIFTEGYRVLKETGHLFLFCDIDLFDELRGMAQSAGFVPWRTPIIWSKGTVGHAPDALRGPRRSYELILFCRKGDHRVRSAQSDVVTIPPDRERHHAAQKPVGIYQHLLGMGTYPGDHVLDPCCGAGTIFEAAKKLQLFSLGIELNERFYEYSSAIARSM